jgi:hypothetical protein
MTYQYRMMHALFLAAALCLTFWSTAGQAQLLNVVFVSPSGSDANDCSTPATACRELTQANTVLNNGGVIHMAPGNYAGVIITKSAHIIAQEGASTALGAVQVGNVGAAIIIDAAATDVVTIRGLVVGRHNFTRGGIGVVSAAAVQVENCALLHSGDSYGIIFRPAGDSELSVTNCMIASNGFGGVSGGGIEVKPGAGAIAKVSIDNVRLVNNRRGMEVYNRGRVTVRNSTIADNSIGVRAAGGQAFVRISNTAISGNDTGLQRNNNGKIFSYGGNMLTDNAVDGTFNGSVNTQ